MTLFGMIHVTALPPSGEYKIIISLGRWRDHPVAVHRSGFLTSEMITLNEGVGQYIQRKRENAVYRQHV